jgi:hypothetical protein
MLEMIFAKAGPGIRFNEDTEGDGETLFRHACKFGLEGIVSQGLRLSFRPIDGLAQIQEPGSSGGEASEGLS